MHKFRLHTLGVFFCIIYAAFMVAVNTTLVARKNEIVLTKNHKEFVNITFEPSVLVYYENVDYICEEIGNTNYFAISNSITEPQNLQIIFNVSDEDRELLARIAWCEAGIEGIDGMMMVICVVLNRVNDPRFPNSVESVLYSPGQFESINHERFNGYIPESAYKAVDNVLSGNYPDHESLYFALSPLTNNGLFKYGRHYFSK